MQKLDMLQYKSKEGVVGKGLGWMLLWSQNKYFFFSGASIEACAIEKNRKHNVSTNVSWLGEIS